jgi:hypothetical protein
MGSSKNPHALHVSPNDKGQSQAYRQWAQNQTVHIFSKKQ